MIIPIDSQYKIDRTETGFQITKIKRFINGIEAINIF